MEQQGMTLDLQDFSSSQSNKFHNQMCSKTKFPDEEIEIGEATLSNKGLKQCGASIISKEELKIRNELENDIEKDLEAEIKEGIYQLALRLQQLYKHQRERNTTKLSKNNARLASRYNVFSEMNIAIRMEGEPRIEMKEIKKGVREKGLFQTYRKGKKKKKVVDGFDWTKTLRTGTSHIANKKQRNFRP